MSPEQETPAGVQARMARRGGQAGQAMTEMVLLFPLFLFFLFGFVKVFSLLVLVQKMEIAGVYVATRWQFESHQNVDYDGFDMGPLFNDIKKKASDYLGFNNRAVRNFLDLDKVTLKIDRTQVWSVVTLRVSTRPWRLPFMKNQRGMVFEITKYVPSRDRPIGYVLPGG